MGGWKKGFLGLVFVKLTPTFWGGRRRFLVIVKGGDWTYAALMPATTPFATSLASLLSERTGLDSQSIDHARVLALYQNLAFMPQVQASGGDGQQRLSHW